MTLARTARRARPASPASMGEAALIERARAMDPAAWDEIFEAHYTAIHRYVYTRTGDIHLSEDLASDVFLEAVRGIARYRYRGIAFRAWLYRIARNITANHQRKWHRSAAAHQDSIAIGEQTDFAPGVVQRHDIRRALVRLTEEQQQVLVLRFFEGLNLVETAEAMGRRCGAIKSLQHRALKRLRDILEGTGD